MKKVIAIDPGHKICGLLLADLECSLAIDGKVALNSSVVNLINYWRESHSVELILLGNGTTSKRKVFGNISTRFSYQVYSKGVDFTAKKFRCNCFFNSNRRLFSD